MFSANLDSDRARERVVLLKGEGYSVAIEDPRANADPCLERVTPSFEGRIPRLRVIEVTGEPPRELVYEGEWRGDNVAGEFGVIFVVGQNRRAGKCLHISRPFRYVHRRTCSKACGWSSELGPPPGHVVGSFRVQPGEREQRFRGLEIRLVELYIRPERKLEGADRRRITLFGCCVRGRYTPYETRLERLP
jgi:hypothetical protein